jgi:26S proteasome non-ATPase regulatory subunit 9
MEITRDYLLELDKKRTKLEKEILDLTEYLNGEGMPGVSGPLTDREGFPIQGVDLTAVRTARNRLIILQNDLSNLMKVIEEKMQAFFTNAKVEKVTETVKPIDHTEGIKVQVFEEEKKPQGILRLPFCYVGVVTEGSPAAEAGLQQGDAIVLFDNIVSYGTHNPLQKIAEIINKKADTEIPITVQRRINNIAEYINITIIPHTWSGQGLLGCKLNLEQWIINNIKMNKKTSNVTKHKPSTKGPKGKRISRLSNHYDFLIDV